MGKEATNTEAIVKSPAAPAPAKKPKRDPLEVLVECPWTKTRLVAEYRGEVNRKGPEPRYKVYSPFFATPGVDLNKAHRWVPRIKILGLAPGREEVEAFLRFTAAEDIQILEKLQSGKPVMA